MINYILAHSHFFLNKNYIKIRIAKFVIGLIIICMKMYQNIVEYYDELFPVTTEQKSFYHDEMKSLSSPAKILRIACGTGSFEHYLAKEGCDVTGIDNMNELLESASRKRRTQLMSLRFFQMTPREMNRFLGKGFYNIISLLDDRIIFINDSVLSRKLFIDCKELLAKNGKFIISLLNYEKYCATPQVDLPVRKSIRSALYSQLCTEHDGTKVLYQKLETGIGKLIPVTENVIVNPLTQSQIDTFAKEAGFKKRTYFADFNRTPFTKDSDTLIAVLS